MQIRQIILSSVLVTLLSGTSAGLAQQGRSDATNTPKVTTITASNVDDTPSASVLLTRQSQRLELLETDLRDMRDIVDTDLRNLKMQITQLSNNATSGDTATTAELRDLRDQIERLADAVAMSSRRMERTLEITSDMEFRLLRMEKRLQTLMKLGGDELASAAVQDDTIAAGDSGNVSMQRDVTTGEVTWQMSAEKLGEGDNNVAATATATTDQQNDQQGVTFQTEQGAAPALTNSSQTDLSQTDSSQTNSGQTNNVLAGADGTAAAPAVAQPEAVPAPDPVPQVLPEGSAEEQYNYALNRAMQNDLETAEAAFAEFRVVNVGHSRDADALFWLGRIQFLSEQYDLAAMTFSEFNSTYPDDARIVDTTMWIAEAVSRFAPADQACAIYASLPNLVDSPPERFTQRLAALSDAANCGG